MRRSFAFGLGSVVLGLVSCADDSPVASPLVGTSPGASSPAALRLVSLRQRFVLPSPEPAALLVPDAPQAQGSPRALLPASQAERWVVREGWLYPEIPDTHRRGITRPVSVRLPPQATGAFEVTDDTSGMKLSVARVGARPAALEQAEGWAMYRGALGEGSEVLHRATAEGTEDYVHLASKPEKEELRYVVDVSAVAGLRLVSNVLEFVNESGDPRLRLTAPMLVDGAGERRELKVGVEGCAYSSDPAPPWGKPVVGPGASQCEVVVRWEAGASYPLLVDPNWTASGSMVQQRSSGHTASLLLDGSVLVVGGGGLSDKTSEVWKGGTWAASGNTVQQRQHHTASVLPDGRVVVVGGTNSPSTSEVWTNGVWAASGKQAQPRLGHTASVLSDGRVLVVGGSNPAAQQVSEVWKGGTWVASGNTVQQRQGHTASVLPDGRVLVAGGKIPPYNTSEVWDDGMWTASGNLVQQRFDHTASVLPDGRVLVAGGSNNAARNTSEVWTNGVWAASGNLVQGRALHTASVLPDGRVLVAGGNSFKTSEVWKGGTWAASGNTVQQRQAHHSASVLQDGRVLVVGGTDSPSTSEVWGEDKPQGQDCQLAVQCVSGFCVDSVCCESACTQPGYKCAEAKTGKPSGQCGPSVNGLPCSQGSECASGFCVDSVCCESACSGACQACSAVKKGSGPDGSCGPIPLGFDPDNECQVFGSGSCQSTGFCDGSGQCDSKINKPCSLDSCSGDNKLQIKASLCDAAGACLAQGSKDCFPFVCAGTSCLTTCSKDQDCQGGYFCQGGSCVVSADQGKTCAKNSECGSNFCVDGVCCDQACTGACKACSALKKGYGNDGACQDIQASADPDNECPEDPASTCKFSGVCDGKGACAQHAQGTSCGQTSCADGKVTGQVCDGQGSCQNAVQPVSCFPYLLCADAAVCAGECASDNQCAPAYFCDTTSDPPTCKKDKIDGALCKKAGECASGNCVDGVCCDSPCDGGCQFCAVEGSQGICTTLLSGKPLKPGVDCGSDPLCGGECKGKPNDCTFPAQGTECAPAACASPDTSTLPRSCDGAGKCAAPTNSSCAPFVCDSVSGACKTKCTTDKDCSTGAVCSANGQCTLGEPSCADGFTAKAPDGSLTKCDPYACLNGQCRSTCSSSTDCIVGFRCEASACVPDSTGNGGNSGNGGNGGASGSGTGGSAGSEVGGSAGSDTAGAGGAGAGGAPVASAEPSEEGGCGCRAAGTSPSGTGAGAAALVALVAVARRRRARS